MELKSRQAYILKIAAENPEGYPIQEVAVQTDTTRRTLYSDFVQINDWLREGKLGELVTESKLMKLHSDRIEEIRAELQKRGNYFYSIEERRTLIILYILLSEKAVTLEGLGKLVDVSKNTILMDVKELKSRLQEKNLRISSTIKGGYELQGEEIAIRKYIGNLINGPKNVQTREAFGKMLQNTLCAMTGRQVDFEDVVRGVLRRYEEAESISLVSEYEKYDISMVLIACIRSGKGRAVHLNEEEQKAISATKAYRFLSRNLVEFEKYNLEIPESEVYYIATILLGIKIDQFLSQEEEDLYIYRFTASLIRNYESIACTVLKDRERLANRLRPHMRALYFRLKYGIQYADPQIEDVRKMYPEVYSFVERAVREMPEELSRELTEVELSYITVYFVSEEKKDMVEQAEFREKILIFCAAGVATSTLIKEQLKELLRDMVEIELGTLKELSAYNPEDYALVISVSPLEALKPYPNVLFTGIVLNEREKEQIIRILSQKGIVGEYDRLVRAIIEGVRKNVTGRVNENELYFTILRILYEEKRAPEKPSLPFSKYIEEQRYEWLSAGSGVQGLLKQGCRKLSAQENVWRYCYENLSHAAERHLLQYYKIMEDVILLHCQMKEEQKRDAGFSVVVSNERLSFGGDAEGKIFIFFATIDEAGHFPALKELYDYCDSEEGRERLRKLINE